MTIDFLDKALCYIANHASFTPTKFFIPEFTKPENELLVRAFYKLEKDGYVYSKTTKDDKGNERVTFYISFDGLLALENSPFLWKNRPYQWKKKKQALNTACNVTKIVAIVINSLIVMYFTYLTYYKS